MFKTIKRIIEWFKNICSNKTFERIEDFERHIREPGRVCNCGFQHVETDGESDDLGPNEVCTRDFGVEYAEPI